MGFISKFIRKIILIFKTDEERIKYAMNNHGHITIKSIIDKACKKKKFIDLNNIFDNLGRYPLYWAIHYNSIVIDSLINYVNQYGMILELNRKVRYGRFPLLEAIRDSNVEIIELLMNYADENNILLDLNQKEDDGDYPLLASIGKDIIYIELIIDYADKHRIILNLNDQDKYKRYPLLMATFFGNIESVRYLINYATKHGIILDLNRKGRGYNDSSEYSTPILNAINHASIEMVQLLIDYSKAHGIKINIDENDIKAVPDVYIYGKLSNEKREKRYEDYKTIISIITSLEIYKNEKVK